MRQIPEFCNVNLTQWLILVTIVTWAIYDLFVRIAYGNDATISVNIRRACETDSAWPFLIGVLIGHLLLSVGHYTR